MLLGSFKNGKKKPNKRPIWKSEDKQSPTVPEISLDLNRNSTVEDTLTPVARLSISSGDNRRRGTNLSSKTDLDIPPPPKLSAPHLSVDLSYNKILDLDVLSQPGVGDNLELIPPPPIDDSEDLDLALPLHRLSVATDEIIKSQLLTPGNVEHDAGIETNQVVQLKYRPVRANSGGQMIRDSGVSIADRRSTRQTLVSKGSRSSQSLSKQVKKSTEKHSSKVSQASSKNEIARSRSKLSSSKHSPKASNSSLRTIELKEVGENGGDADDLGIQKVSSAKYQIRPVISMKEVDTGTPTKFHGEIVIEQSLPESAEEMVEENRPDDSEFFFSPSSRENPASKKIQTERVRDFDAFGATNPLAKTKGLNRKKRAQL